MGAIEGDTGILVQRHKELGGKIKVIHKPDCDHASTALTIRSQSWIPSSNMLARLILCN